jgi:hypothetical protein
MQMLRAKFAYDVRHVAHVHHTNVARTCRARTPFWTPSVHAHFVDIAPELLTWNPVGLLLDTKDSVADYKFFLRHNSFRNVSLFSPKCDQIHRKMP